MTISSIPLAEAPRDPAEMVKCGRWNLRTWAEELGIITDEASKNAFLGRPIADQAQQVLDAIEAAESAGGKKKKGKKAAEPPVRTPVKSKAATPPEDEEEEDEEEVDEEEDEEEEDEEEEEEEEEAPPRKPTAGKSQKAAPPVKSPPPKTAAGKAPPARTPVAPATAKAPPGKTPVVAPSKSPVRTPVGGAAEATASNPGNALATMVGVKKQVEHLAEVVSSLTDTVTLMQEALKVTNRLELTNLCVALRLGSLHTSETNEDTLRNASEEIEGVMQIMDGLATGK